MYFRFDIIYSRLVPSFKWDPNTSPNAFQYDSSKVRQTIGQMNMMFMRFLKTEQWWRTIEPSDHCYALISNLSSWSTEWLILKNHITVGIGDRTIYKYYLDKGWGDLNDDWRKAEIICILYVYVCWQCYIINQYR